MLLDEKEIVVMMRRNDCSERPGECSIYLTKDRGSGLVSIMLDVKQEKGIDVVEIGGVKLHWEFVYYGVALVNVDACINTNSSVSLPS